MNILVVGNGGHANRRVVPALKKISTISSIHIFDRKAINELLDLSSKISIVNTKYLNKNTKKYDLVIICSYPSAHIENFESLKEMGIRFIIEKPISNDFELMTSDKFKKIYLRNKIVESLPFFHHPFWKFLNNLVGNHNFENLESKFVIPNKFDENDFRLNKELGGSAILDNGIYPISCVNALLNIDTDNLIDKKILFDHKLKIDTSGKATFGSDVVKKINLEWGFGREYQNYIKLKSKKLEVHIPFFYSKPEKFIPKVYINNSEEVLFRNIDQFRRLYSLTLKDHEQSGLYNTYSSIYNRYNLMKNLFDD